MDLSVIIVSFNSAGLIERCLASVDTCLRGVTHEICVVDNASSDQPLDLARRGAPGARIIASRENLGFAAGVNRGIAATTGRYVLWLNPDAELLDGGAGELIEYCDRHPGVGILGPQLVDPSGRVQLSCRSFPSYRTALFHRYSLLTRTFPNNPGSRDYLMSDWDHRTVREVDWVSGACLLHRRSVLDDIGGLDERFFMYCEDVDFCLLASLPLWALIAILIKLDDGGPVFYGQERVGWGGRRFRGWKFRSMVPDSDRRFGPLPAMVDDARITRVGRLLRATAMDELPQLWNIFLGDMSFVGPRALAPAEIEVEDSGHVVPLEKIPGYEARHRVRPGLTGITQIYASRDLPRREKFRLDLLYIRKRTFWLDCRLIALSFWITFRGRWEHRGRKV